MDGSDGGLDMRMRVPESLGAFYRSTSKPDGSLLLLGRPFPSVFVPHSLMPRHCFLPCLIVLLLSVLIPSLCAPKIFKCCQCEACLFVMSQTVLPRGCAPSKLGLHYGTPPAILLNPFQKVGRLAGMGLVSS